MLAAAVTVPRLTHGLWELLIWVGNACYFSRFLVQWIASERSGRTEAPRSFWWLSVFGSIFVGAYTWVIGEPVLMLGYVLVLGIYVRNLTLRSARPGHKPPSVLWTLLIAVTAWALVVGFGMRDMRLPTGENRGWAVVAIVGAAIWSSRFIVQWWKSERRGVAYFPRTFWWLSLAGNGFLLAYAVHIGNVGLSVGLSVGPFVQVRNLMIAYRAPRAAG